MLITFTRSLSDGDRVQSESDGDRERSVSDGDREQSERLLEETKQRIRLEQEARTRERLEQLEQQDFESCARLRAVSVLSGF